MYKNYVNKSLFILNPNCTSIGKFFIEVRNLKVFDPYFFTKFKSFSIAQLMMVKKGLSKSFFE